jgi:ATP-dependent DNA ligase
VTLPISKTYPPMEAAPMTSLPVGPQWQYEPKWDGFRSVAFRDNKRIDLQSKSGKPLTRYFPELVAALSRLRAFKFVLDGEIVIPVDGDLSFDQLLMRIHPSASRVEKLSRESPGVFIIFFPASAPFRLCRHPAGRRATARRGSQPASYPTQAFRHTATEPIR